MDVITMKKVTEIYKTDEVKLEQAFQDACSNAAFKKFVYGLNIKEEILMKYTSQLEESFIEYEKCKKCRSLEHCQNRIKGYTYMPINNGKTITFSYDACPKLLKKEKDESYKQNLDLFEMPREIKDASFQKIYTDDAARVPIIKYFKEFIENYQKKEFLKGIYLTGSFGSGKTYLIAALFNEMAKRNVKSILIYYPEFLRSLKASFQTNYSDRFNQIRKIPLLLLDDIGAENVSNWSRDEVLGPILQYRMENHLPTFFTSNLSLEELEKSLSITSSGVDKIKARRIIERIKQLTIQLELISKNRRQ